MKITHIPNGCDQQGRYPQAAEPCTELGQDEPEFYGRAFWKEEAISMVIVAVGMVAIATLLALFFAG
jgi:hypothetical protein